MGGEMLTMYVIKRVSSQLCGKQVALRDMAWSQRGHSPSKLVARHDAQRKAIMLRARAEHVSIWEAHGRPTVLTIIGEPATAKRLSRQQQ